MNRENRFIQKMIYSIWISLFDCLLNFTIQVKLCLWLYSKCSCCEVLSISNYSLYKTVSNFEVFPRLLGFDRSNSINGYREIFTFIEISTSDEPVHHSKIWYFRFMSSLTVKDSLTLHISLSRLSFLSYK